MMEKILELKVFNVKLLQDSMLGYFKMDLGVVYAQLNHCYLKKWLVLVDTKFGESYTKVLLLSWSIIVWPILHEADILAHFLVGHLLGEIWITSSHQICIVCLLSIIVCKMS